MASHVGRLYAIALALFVFFVVWATVAAKPWKSAAPDPRLQAIALRRQALKQETSLVNQLLAMRAKASAAAPAASATPAVRVVTLPPLTITRTS
jgi:hypothetical protein